MALGCYWWMERSFLNQLWVLKRGNHIFGDWRKKASRCDQWFLLLLPPSSIHTYTCCSSASLLRGTSTPSSPCPLVELTPRTKGSIIPMTHGMLP